MGHGQSRSHGWLKIEATHPYVVDCDLSVKPPNPVLRTKDLGQSLVGLFHSLSLTLSSRGQAGFLQLPSVLRLYTDWPQEVQRSRQHDREIASCDRLLTSLSIMQSWLSVFSRNPNDHKGIPRRNGSRDNQAEEGSLELPEPTKARTRLAVALIGCRRIGGNRWVHRKRLPFSHLAMVVPLFAIFTVTLRDNTLSEGRNISRRKASQPWRSTSGSRRRQRSRSHPKSRFLGTKGH